MGGLQLNKTILRFYDGLTTEILLSRKGNSDGRTVFELLLNDNPDFDYYLPEKLITDDLLKVRFSSFEKGAHVLVRSGNLRLQDCSAEILCLRDWSGITVMETFLERGIDCLQYMEPEKMINRLLDIELIYFGYGQISKAKSQDNIRTVRNIFVENNIYPANQKQAELWLKEAIFAPGAEDDCKKRERAAVQYFINEYPEQYDTMVEKYRKKILRLRQKQRNKEEKAGLLFF